jgi:LPXTG-site transpeptidase (sortase) family protein
MKYIPKVKKVKPIILAAALGLLLLVVGTVTLIAIVRSRENNIVVAPPAHTIPATTAKKASDYIGGNPVRIQIPSLNMDLAIIPGVYNKRTQTWTLTLDKVQYATITPEPNNLSGDTFLYGHYRRNVFAYLHTIHSGAQAIVTTDNGHTFYYQLSSVRVVNPDDSASIFDYKGAPILTVQTCTGLFFQNRQLFTFSLVKVV